MRVVQCSNKTCRLRVPDTRAIYRNHCYYCSEKCADGCNPPDKEKEINYQSGVFLFQQRPRRLLPDISIGSWDGGTIFD